jgi:hypothetical protein
VSQTHDWEKTRELRLALWLAESMDVLAVIFARKLDRFHHLLLDGKHSFTR